jgi:uncharacterized protein (TIGR02391 family)
MRLHELIPDADILMSLPPEELAGFLLRVIRSEHPHNCTDLALHQELSEYPRERLDQIRSAVMEAWQSLVNQGLLAPHAASGQSATYVVTRRGRAALTAQAYADLQRASLFPRATLHPAIATATYSLFIRGTYDTAVFEAFRAVEVAVRTAGKFAATDYGVSLMRKAFDPQNGPLINASEPPAERQALSDLFAGAIGRFKNPTSHRHVEITDPVEAVEMIQFASHLLRLVP